MPSATGVGDGVGVGSGGGVGAGEAAAGLGLGLGSGETAIWTVGCPRTSAVGEPRESRGPPSVSRTAAWTLWYQDQAYTSAASPISTPIPIRTGRTGNWRGTATR